MLLTCPNQSPSFLSLYPTSICTITIVYFTAVGRSVHQGVWCWFRICWGRWYHEEKPLQRIVPMYASTHNIPPHSSHTALHMQCTLSTHTVLVTSNFRFYAELPRRHSEKHREVARGILLPDRGSFADYAQTSRKLLVTSTVRTLSLSS